MIYLDFAAATPVSEKVREAMKPYFSDKFFNPSSPYLPAKRVREDYEKAKADIAHTVGAKAADLVMTAGATESINLAFTAVGDGKVLYLVTEHDSVKNTAKQFAHEEILVDKTGLIDLEDFKKKLTDEVTFVSVALASGELGTIQPIAKISEMIREVRRGRLERGIKKPIYLHTDASQALALIDFNVSRLGVDLLTLNSAKVYGPKGVGALYVGHDVKLAPIAFGGGQEMGLRSGTENVAGVVGFAVAAMEAKKHLAGNRKKYEKLKLILKKELSKCAVEPVFLGNKKHQLANFCPVSFPGVDAERLIYQLEESEIYVSTGAACAASKGKKSEALRAIGLTDEEIRGSLRITMGCLNDEEQIRRVAHTIVQLVEASAIPFRAPDCQPVVTGASPLVRSRCREDPENGIAKTSTNDNIVLALQSFQNSQTPATVYVGMSGGVDSSVSALLLKEHGYNVVGVYMKNWSKDLPGMKCPWAEDLADAKRVATKLGIEFKIFDFEKEYKQKVVDYMLDEFKKGRTPNPDIMCNQEVKFKLFYEVAREQGADFIATGHYARVLRDSSMPSRAPDCQPVVTGASPLVRSRCREDPENGILEPRSALVRAIDENKDQTYFLYRMSQEAIDHTIFPIGNMLKPEVKKLAAEKGLDNAYKKESMGVCFVGEVGIKDFLKQYVESEPGEIIDIDSGKKVGVHEGAIFYTIGQRKGLDIGGGLPYYVVRKDMEKNEVYVSRDLNNAELWTDKIYLVDIILRNCEASDMPSRAPVGLRPSASQGAVGQPAVAGALPIVFSRKKIDPENGISELCIAVRLRHRGELIPAVLKGGCVVFEKRVRRPASGQSVVFYGGEDNQVCLGGGFVK